MTTPDNKLDVRQDAKEDALAREHLAQVRSIAHQVRRETGAPVPVEELEALRSFDAGRGVPLRRWVAFRVRCGIFDFLRRHGNLPRSAYKRVRAAEDAARASDSAVAGVPTGNAVDDDINLGDALASAAMAAAIGLLSLQPLDDAFNVVDPSPTPERYVEQQSLSLRMREAIDARPDDERHILQKCYFEDLTIDEASKQIGLSKSWGSRLHARALVALASALRDSV